MEGGGYVVLNGGVRLSLWVENAEVAYAVIVDVVVSFGVLIIVTAVAVIVVMVM